MNWRALIPLVALGCAAQPTTRPEGPSARASRSCAASASADTTVYDTTQVTIKPKAVSGPSISYPDELRQNRISGRVTYLLVVNANGRVDRRSIKVMRSDDIEFERASREYVEQVLFSPGCLNGQAVRVRVVFPIDFKVR